MNSPDGEELSLSPPVDILENANRASGKLGGVAGVLHGVHTWQYKINTLFMFYQHWFSGLFRVDKQEIRSASVKYVFQLQQNWKAVLQSGINRKSS